MGTGSFKKNGISLYLIYQKPIGLNVTLSPVFKLSFLLVVLSVSILFNVFEIGIDTVPFS